MSNSGVAPGAGGVPGGFDADPRVEMRAFDSLPECVRHRLWDFPVKPNCVVMSRNYRQAKAQSLSDERVLFMIDAEMKSFGPRLTRAAYGDGHPGLRR